MSEASVAAVAQEPQPQGAATYAMVLDDLVLKSGQNPIVRGVSIAVPTGRFVGVLGESGAAYVLKWGSYFKYGNTALAVDQLQLMSGNCIVGTQRCNYANAPAALEALSIETSGFIDSYGFNWMMLVIFFLLQRFVAYVLGW